MNEVVAAKLPYGIYCVSHAQDMDKFMEEAHFINDKVAELLAGQEPELGTWWDMEVPAVQADDVWAGTAPRYNWHNAGLVEVE